MRNFKFVLDKLFLFMLVLSVALFIFSFKTGESPVFDTVEKIDLTILGGYYLYFFNGLHKTHDRSKYLKKHWIMLVLLVIPFLPITKLIDFTRLESMFAISTNTVWHFLDEIELL